jgi:hypothetical protein
MIRPFPKKKRPKAGLFQSEKYSGAVNAAFFRLFLEAQKNYLLPNGTSVYQSLLA